VWCLKLAKAGNVLICFSLFSLGMEVGFGIETPIGLVEIYKADPHLLKRASDPK
jgi:hypothetical protein